MFVVASRAMGSVRHHISTKFKAGSLQSLRQSAPDAKWLIVVNTKDSPDEPDL